MGMRLLLVLVCGFFASARWAVATESVPIQKLIALGFQCFEQTAPARLCLGRVDRYPEPVALVIPASWEVASSSLPIIVHFHGYPGPDDTARRIARRYPFAEMLAQTGRRAILVIPFGRGRSETFHEHLANREDWPVFLENLRALLERAQLTQASQVTALALTAHSGGYSAVARVLAVEPRVSEVFLFEALYGDGAPFVTYARGASPARKFYSSYAPTRDDGGRLKWAARANFSLWRELVRVERGALVDEAAFLGASLPSSAGGDAIAAAIARGGPVFQVSDEDHRGTFLKYFPLALRE